MLTPQNDAKWFIVKVRAFKGAEFMIYKLCLKSIENEVVFTKTETNNE